MTIGKGTEWGRNASLPTDAPIVSTDAGLRAHVEGYRRRGETIGPVGVVGGDLWTTMGAPAGGADRVFGPDARTSPIDIGSVLLDGRQFWFVSHLVARRSWWRGRVVVVMNAEWLGDWDLGVRSHPNDGRLDLYETDMSFTERLKARRRLRTGTHIPHPDIGFTRVTGHQMSLEPPLDVWLDGERIGRHRDITLRVEPDALEIVV